MLSSAQKKRMRFYFCREAQEHALSHLQEDHKVEGEDPATPGPLP